VRQRRSKVPDDPLVYATITAVLIGVMAAILASYIPDLLFSTAVKNSFQRGMLTGLFAALVISLASKPLVREFATLKVAGMEMRTSAYMLVIELAIYASLRLGTAAYLSKKRS
jgi:hypothetical protein